MMVMFGGMGVARGVIGEGEYRGDRVVASESDRIKPSLESDRAPVSATLVTLSGFRPLGLFVAGTSLRAGAYNE